MNELGINPTKSELDLHILIRNDNPINDIKTLKLIENWLLKIIRSNEDLKVYNNKMLAQVILNRWLRVCYKLSGYRIKAMYYFVNSAVFRFCTKNASILKLQIKLT